MTETNYADIWQCYKNRHGEMYPFTDDISVLVYDAQYSAIKYLKSGNSREGELSPFLHRGMTCSIINNSTYLAMPVVANQRKKEMYVVKPVQRRDSENNIVLCADHFSLITDQNDKSTPLHLHITRYIPDEVLRNKGASLRSFNNLPLRFVLPTYHDEMDTLLTNDLFLARRKEVHEILTCNIPTTEGGASRRRHRRRAKAIERIRSAGVLSEFEMQWIRLPLHRLFVVVNETQKKATVFIWDRLHFGRFKYDPHQVFIVDGSAHDSESLEALETAMGSMLASHYRWEDFTAYDSDEE